MVRQAKMTWSPRPHCFDLHSTNKRVSHCVRPAGTVVLVRLTFWRHVCFVLLLLKGVCQVPLKPRGKPMGTGDERFEMPIQGPGYSSVVEALATQV